MCLIKFVCNITINLAHGTSPICKLATPTSLPLLEREYKFV